MGSQVRLTLDVDLHNRTDADVADATVTLRDLRLLPKVYGAFPSVSIAAGQSVHLSREFRVPLREYQHLQQGAHPILLIEFRDAAGNLVRHRVVTEPTGREE